MRSLRAMRDAGVVRWTRGVRRTGVAGLVWMGMFAAPPASAQEAEYQLDYDAAIAQGGMDGSYGYVRLLDGSATLLQGDTGERVEAAVNEPLLAGDRLFATGESRIEILLADGNIVRVGDRAQVTFRALANSGDAGDAGSVLELARGTLQLVTSADQRGAEFPAVVTPNATIRARGAGSFLIAADEGRRTEVIVREGVADVTTRGEVAEVRRGERLFVEGTRGDRLDFAAAPDLDRLEAWGLGLRDRTRTAEYAAHVDPDLHYAASSLSGHGSWVHVDAGVAWRPRVSAGWAPYRHGRWRHTPSGMFWVSYEPWGWVPYHYGYWDLHPSWGWVWFPGSRFAGAHVYWYWGPSYAGWIPTGYYWRHYRNHYGSSWGFRFGVYGHIGGGFGRYRHWTFLPHGRLGHRRQHFYAVSGVELGRGRRALERGVLFTDTRGLGRQAWRQPAETLASLRRAVPRDGRSAVDANGFIDRGTRLPRSLERVAVLGRDGRSAVPRQPQATTRVQRPVRSPSDARERTSVRRPAATSGQRTSVRRPATTAGERTSVRRPTMRTRSNPVTRSSGVQRVTRESPAEVRRPARPPTARDRRPTVHRPTVGAGATRPTLRRPSTRPQTRPADVRRPTQPTVRPSVRRPAGVRPTFSRPATVRPSLSRPGAPRPSMRRPAAARPAPRSAIRSAPASRRPAARPAAPRPSRSGTVARPRGRSGPR